MLGIDDRRRRGTAARRHGAPAATPRQASTCRREQRAALRLEHVEGRARPRVDLQQPGSIAVDKKIDRCSARPAAPPRRERRIIPASVSAVSAANRRRRDRTAIAERRVRRGAAHCALKPSTSARRPSARTKRGDRRARHAAAGNKSRRLPSPSKAAFTCCPPAPPRRLTSQPLASAGRRSETSGCGMPQARHSAAKASGSLTRATISGALPISGQRSAICARSSGRSSNPVPQTIPSGRAAVGERVQRIEHRRRLACRSRKPDSRRRHACATATVSWSPKKSATRGVKPPRRADAASARPEAATINTAVLSIELAGERERVTEIETHRLLGSDHLWRTGRTRSCTSRCRWRAGRCRARRGRELDTVRRSSPGPRRRSAEPR